MGERYRHQGATTGPWQYPHKVRCWYSGNVGTVYTSSKTLTQERQDDLDIKYMRNQCICDRCVDFRNSEKRMIGRLVESEDYETLKTLGYSKDRLRSLGYNVDKVTA